MVSESLISPFKNPPFGNAVQESLYQAQRNQRAVSSLWHTEHRPRSASPDPAGVVLVSGQSKIWHTMASTGKTLCSPGPPALKKAPGLMLHPDIVLYGKVLLLFSVRARTDDKGTFENFQRAFVSVLETMALRDTDRYEALQARLAPSLRAGSWGNAPVLAKWTKSCEIKYFLKIANLLANCEIEVPAVLDSNSFFYCRIQFSSWSPWNQSWDDFHCIWQVIWEQSLLSQLPVTGLGPPPPHTTVV